jgi:hypothetical protein
MNDQVDVLNTFVNECMAESKVGYVGLWQIAQTTRERLGATTAHEAKKWSLRVVKSLFEKGLRPGNYWGKDFGYWPEQACQAALDRIEREWIALGHDPTLGDPICWFAPQPDK